MTECLPSVRGREHATVESTPTVILPVALYPEDLLFPHKSEYLDPNIAQKRIFPYSTHWHNSTSYTRGSWFVIDNTPIQYYAPSFCQENQLPYLHAFYLDQGMLKNKRASQFYTEAQKATPSGLIFSKELTLIVGSELTYISNSDSSKDIILGFDTGSYIQENKEGRGIMIYYGNNEVTHHTPLPEFLKKHPYFTGHNRTLWVPNW